MINGIINVYKERGFTSFDVVAKLRGILHERKIGHTGTLDPEATGVLPICIGNATKVCELLTDKDKVYRTVMHLGITTDTQDMTGTVKEDRSREAALLKEQTVEAAILQFVGDYEQIPPMYSALKVNGKKLCDLARAGIEVERKARTVKIFSIEIEKINLPYVTMQVHCSKGTYIRTLCADIGEALGVGACMESLVRTRVCILYHGIEIVTLFGIGCTLSIIGINPSHFPVVCFLYFSGIIFYLCLVATLLLFKLRADSAVSRYPQFLL